MKFELPNPDFVHLYWDSSGIGIYAFDKSFVPVEYEDTAEDFLEASLLTPDQARQLAQALLQAANELDPVSFENPVTCPHCGL